LPISASACSAINEASGISIASEIILIDANEAAYGEKWWRIRMKKENETSS